MLPGQHKGHSGMPSGGSKASLCQTAQWQQQKPDRPASQSLAISTEINDYEGHFGRGRGRRARAERGSKGRETLCVWCKEGGGGGAVCVCVYPFVGGGAKHLARYCSVCAFYTIGADTVCYCVVYLIFLSVCSNLVFNRAYTGL